MIENPFAVAPKPEPVKENPEEKKAIVLATNLANAYIAEHIAEQEENLDLDKVAELIASKEEALKNVEKIGESFAAEEAEDAEAMAELQKQLDAIRVRQRERDSRRNVARQEWQRVSKELEDAKRQQTTFLSKQEIIRKTKEEYNFYLTEVSPDAPWRERARKHQLDGAVRLAIAERAICGDKPGLGKTLESIMFMDLRKSKRVLVIAPADTLSNYKQEMETWAPHRMAMIMGGKNKLERDMWFMGFQALEQFTILINYEAWRKDYDDFIEALRKLNFDTVICDEAHNMAEGKTKAFKGVHALVYAENICEQCGSYTEVKRTKGKVTTYLQCTACQETYMDIDKRGPEGAKRRSVKNVLPMTGTSIKSKPQNIWTLLNLVDRDEFPSLNAFLNRFCVLQYVERAALTDTGIDYKTVGVWKFAAGGQERLMKRLGHRIVARSPESAGVEMPPQKIIHHELSWDGQYIKQRQVMNWIRSYYIKTGDESAEAFSKPITRLLRMRQALCWPAGIKFHDPETRQLLWQADAHESIIIDKAMQITTDAIDADDRVLIFSQFKEALKEVERRCIEMGITVCRYDGDTPEDLKLAIKADVDSKIAETNPDIHNPYHPEHNPNGYKYQVVLANYKSGGTGLNIDLCRQTIFLDRDWTPAGEDQAMARTARINTKWGSQVHMIHVPNTISDVMDEIIEIKREVVDGYEREVDMVEMLQKALRQEY